MHLHCGDSRIYHYRGGELLHKTRDQTIVQVLVDNGQLRPEEAATHPMRSQLTSCLGGGGSIGSMVVEPTWNLEATEQPARLALEPGDLVLLCSDGLSGEIPPEALDQLVRAHGQHPATLAQECIQAALAAGGRDNVTVVAMRWLGAADQGGSVAPPPAEEANQG
jgi:protein phosphatase